MTVVDRSKIRWRHGSGAALMDDIDADRAARDTANTNQATLQPGTGSEDIDTGASPVALDPAVAVSNLTSDGATGAGQSITLADGTVLGQRKLIVAADIDTGNSDTIVLNANIVDTSITFDADGEEVLLEFDGADWAVVLNNGATVA